MRPAKPAASGLAAPLVSVRGITKTFANGTTALDNVSFDVRQGDFLSLVGPSGCGIDGTAADRAALLANIRPYRLGGRTDRPPVTSPSSSRRRR